MTREWKPTILSPIERIVVNEPEALRQWRTKNYRNTEEEQADKRLKSLVLYSPELYGKLAWAQSLGGDKVYQNGPGDPLYHNKMTHDADCIVFQHLAGAKELLDLHMHWICVQGAFDAEKDAEMDATDEGVYISLRQRPSIFLMTDDPRDDCGEDRDLLEYLFDFIPVSTPLCVYDSEPSTPPERQDEQDERWEDIMSRVHLFRHVDDEPVQIGGICRPSHSRDTVFWRSALEVHITTSSIEA
ncbi:hypothetical protein SCP_1400380 [Sparassis crispa]|uniref:Uncharacterized protein n=1 Tax=Sparassis crispa TaxID=139825 RepID=A0A401H2L6_9APHY|nr:hypothetical protein SCP_1400380 [Sparassis crispa]GBE88633.1 hypothetical protein SCP_1400380 [Sparassis crispa]